MQILFVTVAKFVTMLIMTYNHYLPHNMVLTKHNAISAVLLKHAYENTKNLQNAMSCQWFL